MRKAMTAAMMMVASIAWAQSTTTAVDKAFVAKVSQGGMYEVEASKVAVDRAQAQDVKDLAAWEVHDHQLVGDKLKSVASGAGDSFPTTLNAEFQARLNKLKGISSAPFDAAYLADMRFIHAKDEKLFAAEAVQGSGAFKSFAHETDLIVKRHIGGLL